MKHEELRPVITYPRDAIVEMSHVVAAFQDASPEAIAKMDLPSFYAGRKQLFLWGQILDVLAERAMPTKPALRKSS